MGIFSAIDQQIAQHKAGKDGRKFAKAVVIGKTYYCIVPNKMVTGEWGDLVHEYTFTRMSSTITGRPMPMCGTMSAERAWNLYGPFYTHIPKGLQTLAQYNNSSVCTDDDVAKKTQQEFLKELGKALVRV
ncbi:hypothetical protein [Streptomyces sp. AA1529]|uniref:hypothetical protein n=1 Tax=Streptomyces sp. AA1529 TaxID=1203257 RepID=UPI0002FFB716|nr:hypothetical protein [Streptomyces sp. AA1529]